MLCVTKLAANSKSTVGVPGTCQATAWTDFQPGHCLSLFALSSGQLSGLWRTNVLQWGQRAFFFVASWFDPFPFPFLRVGACSPPGESSPCPVVPFAFLCHLPLLHSSSPSLHPCWPCLLLSSPQSACRVVPIALQTTWPVILLLPWLLLFLGKKALPL